MANLDLTKYASVDRAQSFLRAAVRGRIARTGRLRKGSGLELGLLSTMKLVFTLAVPLDRYIVMDENSKDAVWWTSDEYKNDNHPMARAPGLPIKDIAKKELCNKRLFVVGAFCSANKDTRMAWLHRGSGLAGTLLPPIHQAHRRAGKLEA